MKSNTSTFTINSTNVDHARVIFLIWIRMWFRIYLDCCILLAGDDLD